MLSSKPKPHTFPTLCEGCVGSLTSPAITMKMQTVNILGLKSYGPCMCHFREMVQFSLALCSSFVYM